MRDSVGEGRLSRGLGQRATVLRVYVWRAAGMGDALCACLSKDGHDGDDVVRWLSCMTVTMWCAVPTSNRGQIAHRSARRLR